LLSQANLDAMKSAVIDEIDSFKARMVAISETIHANPELGLKEFNASELLSSELEKHGFAAELGIAGMPTAFKAVFALGNRAGPNLAYLAEYDALPQIGHACGHNIIGTSAVFAAIALSKLAGKLDGRITVFGTPDEEGSGGKIPLIKAGVFEGVDAAVMNHPWNLTSPWMPTVALDSLRLEFTGKAAHYSTPHKGVNALDGVVLTLSALHGLRHGFRNDVIYGYTIDQGGVTPSIIPEKAIARLWIKSKDVTNLAHVVEQVKTCAEGIAGSIGAKVRIQHEYPLFEESIPNLTMIRSVSENFSRLGIPFTSPEETSRSLVYASTDYGNVSHVVPSVSPAIAIGPETLDAHTEEFAEAAISDRGRDALVEITKAMAMTGIDILGKTGMLKQSKTEFAKYRESGFIRVPFALVYG
jgi:amidohydrolase